MNSNVFAFMNKYIKRLLKLVNLYMSVILVLAHFNLLKLSMAVLIFVI